MPESSSFFLAKNVLDNSAIDLTYSALRAFDKFQQNVEYQPYFDDIDKTAFNEYFMTKAATS